MTYTLYNLDCLQLMHTMDAGSVDCVITDPPYGINIANNPFRQKFEKSDWDNVPIDDKFISEMFRVSKFQIIWGGNYFNLPVSKNFLVWDKCQPQNFSSSMCEQAWTNIDMPAKMFRYSVTSYKKEHPTQKPLPLMMWCLSFLPDCKTVFDPFMGSGTTGVACMMTGRNFIGCEKDAGYYAIAEKRIHDASQQMLLPLDI